MVLRHFSNAGLLRAVEPHHLMELLERHADYFAARGVDIGTNGDGLDYDAVAHVLMTPDERTPSALIDDLHVVDEMATPDSMDAMLDAAHAAGVALDVGADPTPADVAVRLRRCKPELLEQIHAEQCLLRHLRTFEYFQSKSESDITHRTPDVHKQRAFENALGRRLEAMKRGRACRLCVFPRKDGVWFLVRRGDRCTRNKTIPCRPEKYDVVKYDERRGELSVNAHNHGKLIAIYRELFGELLFDDPWHFEAVSKYVLDPLQSAGPDALICSDVDGVHCITLREVQICWSGAHG
ncbi:MAG: hypothetical protein FWD69_19850, partial [Polyangiaceae bacterium]|nr:hypothetical protein [Polyangiaceae bacterium]